MKYWQLFGSTRLRIFLRVRILLEVFLEDRLQDLDFYLPHKSLSLLKLLDLILKFLYPLLSYKPLTPVPVGHGDVEEVVPIAVLYLLLVTERNSFSETNLKYNDKGSR